jgi:Protein of unknown function (DUF2911)
MRHLRLALAMITAAAALPLTAQQPRKSPHETVSAVIGERATGIRVTIVYGRPYTKDPKTGEPRKVWGGLVPWGQAYRLGADEATLLVNQKPVVIQGALVPAGAHVLYLVPSETGASKLAISTNVGGWGVPVDETHDLARVDLKKDALDKPVDQLTLALEKDPAGGALLRISWENTQFTASLKAPGVDFPAASPASTLKQRVGVTDVEVAYSRPSMRGRAIFGGLVPYGEVWRTGANSATTISFSTPVSVQGAHVDAGTYELFTIPGADEWTVILQKASKQWGAYEYNPKNDVARVTAKPVALEAPYETFTIGIGDVRDDSATLNLVWEKTRVRVKIETDIVSMLVPQIDAMMAGSGRKPYVPAAMFYLEHNLDLKKAVGWMDTAIADQPDFFPIIYRKALIQAKMGDKDGAIETAKRSMELASKATGPEKGEYIRLNEALIASLK